MRTKQRQPKIEWYLHRDLRQLVVRAARAEESTMSDWLTRIIAAHLGRRDLVARPLGLRGRPPLA